MQGKKHLTPQLFYHTSLEKLVPADNMYRMLNNTLDLQFLYPATRHYYGKEGQESIDPVVFFKILLVGYLNNISSDRTLLRYCADCLSVRLFLGYDLGETLPWHSTISRTYPSPEKIPTLHKAYQPDKYSSHAKTNEKKWANISLGPISLI
jgi:transposase